MSMLGFLGDAVKGIALTTSAIVALPVLGPVGAISTVGAVVAVAVGTTAAAIDHASDED